MRTASVLLWSALAVGCTTYDFEPVVPLALGQSRDEWHVIGAGLKPNVMLLIDRSASMEQPVDPADPACPVGCGYGNPCPNECPTRLSELRAAMADFLGSSSTDARLGLTLFPTDAVCGGPARPDVDLPAPSATDQGTDAALVANATAINERIQGLQALGGTPTAASLRFVGGLAGLRADDFRDDLVVLLTDGLPNCNEENAHQMCSCNAAVCGDCSGGVCAAQQTACRCTMDSCVGNCARGCLDADSVVDATRRNRTNRIRTIVVGFGADTARGDAPEVLNSIADEGALPRACPQGTDAECGGGDRCLPSGLCERRYFQAGNAAELTQILRSLVDPPPSCVRRLLEQPGQDGSYLAVQVDGQHVPSGPDTWTYSAGAVTFTGPLCEHIRTASPASPLDIQFFIVTQL
jgi:hypothetical protein